MEEPNEHLEKKINTKCINNPLTDSELNALAAKQIKAELMGNTVSCIFIIIFNNIKFGFLCIFITKIIINFINSC